MYHKQYRVIAYDTKTRKTVHNRSVFVEKQDAIDRAHVWIDRGCGAKVIDRRRDVIVWLGVPPFRSDTEIPF